MAFLGVIGTCCLGAVVAQARQVEVYRPPAVTMVWDTARSIHPPLGGYVVPFEAFHPALGTLQDIQFDYVGLLTSSLSARNNSVQPYSGNLVLSARLVVEGPGLSVDDPSRSTFYTSALAFSLMAGQQMNAVPLAPAITFDMPSGSVPPSSFPSYQGVGNVGMRYHLVVGEALSPSRLWLSTGLGYRMTLTAGITYRYIPVPEPTPVGLMALGLGIVGGARLGRRGSGCVAVP